MAHPEYDAQVAVFNWAKLYEKKYPCLEVLMGSIMGVKLPAKLLNKHKKAGMKKGKPDINLPVPRGGFCGLWIELKADGKDVTADQRKMLCLLNREGNACYRVRGSFAAIRLIEDYINGLIVKEE